ncbi:MAG: HAD hydrolase family protein [Planctomycetota bacterium]
MPLNDIGLFAFDVDGVLTNGVIAFTPDHEELKAFHVHDGIALKWLESSGIRVALVTARRSRVVDQRARELNLSRLLAGQDDKLLALTQLAREFTIDLARIAYMGDDLPDLPALMRAGYSFTVPDAPAEVRSRVHYVTEHHGGGGAVREAAELVLKARGLWDGVVARYLSAERSPA